MNDIADRRAQFLAQLRAQRRALSKTPRPSPRQRSGPAPLSFAQETLWFLDRLAPGRPTYNVPMCFRLRKALDVDALRKALAAVVARHESLRTYFTDDADAPVQIVQPEIDIDLVVTRVGDEAEIRRLAAEVVRRPFDLSSAPLWRASLLELAPDDHVLVFVVHHIVVDAWSLGVFTHELAVSYAAAKECRQPQFEPLPIQYVNYAEWQREWLQGETLDKLVGHWRGRLDGVPVLDFPTDRPRPPSVTFDGTSLLRFLSSDICTAVGGLARQERVSPYTVYLAAFFAVLHHYTSQTDLVVGSPMMNRSHAEVQPVIGFFVNMLVLRADASGDPTFREFVRRIGGVVQDAFAHGDLPFDKLVEAVVPVRDPSRLPIFQMVFSFQNAGSKSLQLAGLDVEPISVDSGAARFDLSWTMTENQQGLGIGVEFNSRLFDSETIDQLISHYENVLRAAMRNPEVRLGRIDILGKDERNALIHAWQGSRRDESQATIVERFEHQVARAPDALALVVEGRGMTYFELHRRSNRLARKLLEIGVKPDKAVAVCLPRSEDLLVCVLAILKSGGAYVPLDPAHPPARLGEILRDAGSVAVLTTQKIAEALPADVISIKVDTDAVELQAHSDDDLPHAACPGNLAYVLYTSGSTGKPKGVLIEHRNVVRFIQSVQRLFNLTPEDRVLGFAAMTFDVSVFEMFAALLTGARLYLATDEERVSTERLQALMEVSGITVIDLPPTVMALLEPERFGALRIVFAGGEAFPGDLVNRWSRGRRFFNGYGPTECTVTMIVEECRGDWQSSPPIGLPMENHVALVLNGSLEPVPIGVPGELVIGGAGLARGYLNRRELTAEKFIADPFGIAPEGGLYRTGDLVKRLRDGRILFLGRIDRQVKIRGIRIELGEIESVLASHPDVGQTVVEPWTSESGERHLVAYLSSRSGADLDLGVLRSYLSDRLPTAMLPGFFVALPELPLTPSGKIDRAKLPPPETSRPIGAAMLPRTVTERALVAKIFEPLLKIRNIGIHDSFFELGGNSLQATQLISRVRSRFDVEISLAEFFRSPTVAHLGILVDRSRMSQPAEDELPGMADPTPDPEAARPLDPGVL